jgi:chorismate mutase
LENRSFDFQISRGFEKDSSAMSEGKLCRGVRGATTVEANSREAILKATRQLLALMIRRNGIESTDIASAIFTVTRDLNAEFPALAARQMGLLDVPLLCGYEVEVPGSLMSCVRILLHWNTTAQQSEIHHVYIHDAVALRPDLSKLPPVDWRELEEWISVQMSSRETK